MAQAEVLIIADDIHSGRVWADGLRHHSVQSRIIQFEQAIKEIAGSDQYHLVVVDSHNNSKDALAFCRQIRTECEKPIILLTYESDDRYQMQAYYAGVDECVTKPLSVLLFNAKAAAWLRHGLAQHSDTTISVAAGTTNGAMHRTRVGSAARAGLSVDQRSRLLSTPNGQTVKLSILECRLLSVLVANQGRVLGTDYLLNRVWDQYTDVDRRLLTNLVYRLRQKLEAEPIRINNIRTVEGVGYVYE